uniref:ANL07 n=1 Tax=Synechococcus elongatus (strain ATCC 33912 / PCC 7942 / FACHB-805) TaxID=1140 RepID=Q8KUW6_SYNE7|nr:ANL07 [Synechococcus elongatus PCC 7942 = FACHB-805]
MLGDKGFPKSNRGSDRPKQDSPRSLFGLPATLLGMGDGTRSAARYAEQPLPCYAAPFRRPRFSTYVVSQGSTKTQLRLSRRWRSAT